MKVSLLNRTKTASVVVISLMMGVPSVASATDFFSSDNPIYVGVGFGKNKVSNSELAKFEEGGSLDIGGSTSAKTAFIGKKYNRNLDIEAFYMDLGSVSSDSFTVVVQNGGNVNTKVSVKNTMYGIKTNYKFMLESDFKPYVTAGYGKMKFKKSYSNGITRITGIDSKISSSDSGAIYGVGVLTNYSKKITFRAEYIKVSDDMNFFWGGVSTTF